MLARTLPLLCLALILALSPETAPRALAQDGESFNMEIRRDREGEIVSLKDLLSVLNEIYPGEVEHTWEPEEGTLRIQANGRTVEALLRRPVVVLNTRTTLVDRPLVARQGELLIPFQTVKLVFDTFGIEYERTGAATPPQPTPTPAAVPGAPASQPEPLVATPTVRAAAPPVPLLVLQQRTTHSQPLAAVPTLPPQPVIGVLPTPTPASPLGASSENPIAEQSLDAAPAELPAITSESAGAGAGIEAPAGLAGKIGLSWSQLADAAHRVPPQRLVIVHDKPLDEIAAAVRDGLPGDLAMQVELLEAPSARRDGESLATRVNQRGPQLVLDLVAQPLGAGERAVPSVWVVHESLWPDGGALAASAPGVDTYRRHQFQGLALGSVIRGALARQVEGSRFELAPSYLLRRLDAPSAAVLIPVEGDMPSGVEPATIAQGLINGIADYARGMRQAAGY